MQRQNIYIGVAWPYVNGDIHVGHLAGYLLPADIFARFHRYIDNNVLMVSGSDCHGTPITVEAEKRNKSPQEIVNLYHPKFKKLFNLYGISFDLYTKTTTENHKKVVQDIFIRLAKKRLIFKKKSKQFFSPQENRFLPDRYVEGTCPYCDAPDARGDQCDQCGRVLNPEELINPKSRLTNSPVELKETEHYYFDLPKLKGFLKNYVAKVGPSWRHWVYQETLGWLRRGLEPRCITRDLDWGIPIPIEQLPRDLKIKHAENKRIYVWFEAVIGYLSASIEWAKNTGRWQDFWYQSKARHYYFMGKDNLVFHTLFWPAQLYGAYGKQIHLPDFPVINHFLDLEGQAFSKSRGITVDSYYIGEKYGVDPVRFYLTWIMPEEADASFSWSGFIETNNNVLIATFGNFLNRVLKLSQELNDFSAEDLKETTIKSIENQVDQAFQFLSRCQFKNYAQALVGLADWGNKYLNQTTPWTEERNSSQFKKIMTNALLVVLAINLAAEPLIPKSNQKLSQMLGIKIDHWPKKGVGKYLTDFLSQIKITNPTPLFTKIDPNLASKEKAKLNS